ncbi:MAG: MaoC/PaaZ C-terminal domain-containing protein [Pseudomonadota bacterium]
MKPSQYIGLIRKAFPQFVAYGKSVWRELPGWGNSRRRQPGQAGAARVQTIRNLRAQPDSLEEYLALTDGADLGFSANDILPPMYFTTWGLRPYLDVLCSEPLSLNLWGLIQVQNDLVVHRPIATRDKVDCLVSAQQVHRDGDRTLVTVLAESRVDGELTTEVRTTLLADRKRIAQDHEESLVDTDENDWQEIRNLRFGADLGRRYGLLTGDLNPIHLHPITSRLFGFERPIVHGFCLKAMVAHALIRQNGGDPKGFQRLKVRFRAPVALPSEGVCETCGNRFRVVGEDGRLLADGRFRMVAR